MATRVASESWRSEAFRFIDGRATNRPGSRAIGRFIVCLIVLNGLAVILESNHGLYVEYMNYFIAFEVFSVSIFTVEYVYRFWFVVDDDRYTGMPHWKARLAYMVKPMALIDLLAIAPFYLALFFPIDLRYLRLFRLMRLLKLSHYFSGLHVFGAVLKREAAAIAGALLTIIILIVVSACLMFSVENAVRPGHFESIAQAIWWAVVTLTTVGYGDVTPVTFAGKLLAIVIMLLGVGTMALPAGIMAARFTEELQYRREFMRSRVKDALSDGLLDDEESEAIEVLQRELGLTGREVEQLITLERQALARNHYCPHCGKPVSR
jgi:voltage-gated potassium channel